MSHPFIPAPNTALVELVYTYASQIIENTFHVESNVPFTATTLQSLTQNLFDVWDSTGTFKWCGVRASACSLQQVKGRALDTASSPVYIYTLPTPRIGLQGSGINMPANVTFAVTLQTGVAGRSYRGRIYVPGFVTGNLQANPAQNLVTTAIANAFVASINSLIAQIPAFNANWHLVITSYYNNLAWRTTAVNTRVLNAAYADLAIDSQRRRLAFRGA